MITLLYNEFANSGKGKEDAENAVAELQSLGVNVSTENMASLVGLDPKPFFSTLDEHDTVIIHGGDGTLNHLINNIGEVPFRCALLLYPSAGTGNDFQRDLPEETLDKETGLYRINDYVKNLPFVEVKGKKYRFLNGIGFGIDGECCVKAQEMKAAGEGNVDYGSITVKLLMGPFSPSKATIRLDGGDPITIPKTYLASAMNGRYYGGGMAIAPKQDRFSGKLTFVCIHGKGKFGTLLLLPKLFSGTHVKNKKHCYLAYAKTIEVEFDRPCGLQIDGEVVIGVTSYKAYVAE